MPTISPRAMRHAGCSLLLAAFAGCIPINAKRGTDLSKVDQFTIEKHKTTENELIEKLGAPTSTTMTGDGTKTLLWGGGTTKSHMNLVGVLVPFALMADPHRTQVDTKSLMVQVREGIVVDYSMTSGNQQY
ncbi:MAG TPA: hypothetical protein VF624_04345 [Tepidisphaeraceae bacterium]